MKQADMTDEPIEKTDEDWRRDLDSERYRILRQKGTERAFSGEHWNTKEPGTYLCAGCGQELFDSAAKYDSGSGWPSFWSPQDDDAVSTETDLSHGMRRTEVMCRRCGGHLGHVFPDGPAPTGLRYCINSGSLEFHREGENE